MVEKEDALPNIFEVIKDGGKDLESVLDVRDLLVIEGQTQSSIIKVSRNNKNLFPLMIVLKTLENKALS